MYRCAPLAPLVATVLAVSALSATAQTHRFFPPQALRGELMVTQYPDVMLNGQAARLAPGSRIKGDTNLLLQPASLAGQKLIVHYTVEPGGLLMDVWVLNPAELANKTWPRTPAESATWAFNPGNQTWLKP
jgi:hypothetical protein